MNRSPELAGNLLDLWVRNGQDRQTIGIPIGPDTSLVIAELVLSSVDEEFSSLGGTGNGFRRVDDYEFGFASRSNAEENLALLQQALAKHELALNPRKTTIKELPVPLEEPWATELRATAISESKRGQARGIVRLFDRAFSHSKLNPDVHVLNYAIGIIGRVEIHPESWPIYQDLLLQCAMVEPGTLRFVLDELVKYSGKGFESDTESISEVLNHQIIRYAPLGHSSEVSWAVWGLMEFGLQVEPAATKQLSNMEDPVVALLALDCNSRGLISASLDCSAWQSELGDDALYSEQWLLSYEATIKEWLPASTDPPSIERDENFTFLKELGVSFYDPNKTIRKPSIPEPDSSSV